MRNRKSIIAGALACLVASALILPCTGCSRNEVELDSEQFSNYTMPEVGEDIVVMTIKDYGSIKIRLFPEDTPKGVENFTELVKKGFYDELIFHRIISGFMIQGGDPRGDGTGGEDCWGSKTGFAQTISPRLCHFPGAVAYAIGQDKMNKSQFYIVTGEPANEAYFEQLAAYGYTFTKAGKEMYEKYGGRPHLDGGYEIFGQVFDGLDLILDIQNVATDANDRPKKQVVIEKAEVVPYDGAAPHWLDYQGNEIQPG